MVEIGCSKCSRTFYVDSEIDALPPHSDDEGHCEGSGHMGKIINTHVDQVPEKNNIAFIGAWQQDLEKV
ncbi:MAG: hypothetical protein WCP93_02985 [Candidatus Berkelbacteria bacterium]